MLRHIFRYLVVFIVLCAAIGVAGWWGWHEWAKAQSAAAPNSPPSGQAPAATSVPVRLSPQARANLKLITKPLKPTTYWRTVEFPGVIVDRPGITDRGVVAPVTGVVTKVHAFPGDAVDPLAPLFTLRLQSDSLYNSQLELFKAAKDMELARNKLERLSDAARSGALPGARVIEIEDQIERFSATVQAYRQDLKARGLPDNQIEAAEAGKFVTEIVVRHQQSMSNSRLKWCLLRPNRTAIPCPLPLRSSRSASNLGRKFPRDKCYVTWPIIVRY